MKKSWLGLVVGASLLSGCTGMMYGGGVAPVANQNTYNGQTGNQKPIDGWQKQSMTPRTTTQVSRSPARPVARQQPSTQESPFAPELPQKSSPYIDEKSVSVNDGWSVRPQTDVNSAPQVEQSSISPNYVATEVEESSQGQIPPIERDEDNRPKPVRPESRNPESVAYEESGQTQSTQEPTQKETNVASATPPVEKSAPGGSAVSTLLQKANSELGKANLDGAASYLEDAHRIDSKNPNILYDIANIRLHQKRYREAEAAAAKAANVGGSSGMMRKSWALIASARKALGDNQGAIAAAEKAASF